MGFTVLNSVSPQPSPQSRTGGDSCGGGLWEVGQPSEGGTRVWCQQWELAVRCPAGESERQRNVPGQAALHPQGQCLQEGWGGGQDSWLMV